MLKFGSKPKESTTTDAVGEVGKAKITFEQTSPPAKKKKAAGEGLTLTAPLVANTTLPPDKTQYMEGWTDEQWDTLQMSALKVLKMIANPAVNNKAWRNQLKITLDTINGFRK